jgi:hypothetical protein
LAVVLVVCGHDEDERAALRSVIALAASGYEVDRGWYFRCKMGEPRAVTATLVCNNRPVIFLIYRLLMPNARLFLVELAK